MRAVVLAFDIKDETLSKALAEERIERVRRAFACNTGSLLNLPKHPD